MWDGRPRPLPKTAWKLAKLQTPAFRDGADLESS